MHLDVYNDSVSLPRTPLLSFNFGYPISTFLTIATTTAKQEKLPIRLLPPCCNPGYKQIIRSVEVPYMEWQAWGLLCTHKRAYSGSIILIEDTKTSQVPSSMDCAGSGQNRNAHFDCFCGCDG
jgi:hypothetical protein